jgi:hypothetical protein
MQLTNNFKNNLFFAPHFLNCRGWHNFVYPPPPPPFFRKFFQPFFNFAKNAGYPFGLDIPVFYTIKNMAGTNYEQITQA